MRRLVLGVSACGLIAAAASADTTYEYDALGRVMSVTYDDGSSVEYEYDAVGNRTEVTESLPTSPPPPPPPSCSGYEYDGYCYFRAAPSQSCDAACAAESLSCDLPGTKHIGSDAPDAARCLAVAQGIGSSVENSLSLTGHSTGCNYYDDYVRRYSSPTTTCDGSISSWRRYCACE